MNRSAVEHFVAANFKVRKCRRYVRINYEKEHLTPNEKRMFLETDCACGNSLEWHVQNGINSQLDSDFNLTKRPWSVVGDTAFCACDTFGELTFRPGRGVDSTEVLPRSTAKYIRLDGRSKGAKYLDAVYELMTSQQYWGIPKPGLLIEITGATNDFPYVDQITIDKFNDGLIKAAESSNAWIITNGLHRGVAKLVADAFAEARMAGIDCNVTCLGIASWGTIEYRECLAPVPNKGRTPSLPTISGETDQFPVGTGKWSANYYVDNKDLNGAMPLDQNHSCFILVDNGREKRFGEEIAFRAHFLDHISRKKSSLPGDSLAGGAGNETWTPSLLIVIAGGETALKTVEETLSTFNAESDQSPRPVIVLPGFGGTADLIAYAYEITEKGTEEEFKETGIRKHEPKIANKQGRARFQAESVFPEDFDKQIREHHEMEWLLRQSPEHKRAAKAQHFVGIIRKCLTSRKLITVFDLFGDSIDDKEALDKIILQAIFKAELGTPAVMLDLAQNWNRADFAKTILDQHAAALKNMANCEEAMRRAISNGQAAFCKLLDDYNIVETRKFVTRNVMWEIYERVFIKKSTEVKKSCVNLFRRFLFKRTGAEHEELPENPEFLKILGEILSTKLGCYLDNLFTEQVIPIIGKPREEDENGEEDDGEGNETINLLPDEIHTSPLISTDLELARLARKMSLSHNQIQDSSNVPYISGMRDLFLFSLLVGSDDMATIFWFKGQDHLGTALFAAKLLQTLAKDAEKSGLSDLASEYEKWADDWQNRAINLLTVCYDDNPEKTDRLLTRSLATWQGYSVLEIAFHANQQDFMGHPAVQTKLKQLWYDRVAPFSNRSLVYLSAFFFPLVYKIQFVSSYSNNKHLIQPYSTRNSEQVKKTEKMVKRRFVGVRWGGLSEDENSVNFFRAVYYIYSSPMIKFLLHSIATFISLLAFSYFIILGPNPDHITPLEVYIWSWAFVTFAELVRESLGEELLNNFRETFICFFCHVWNWIDLIAGFCLACSFAMRFALQAEYFVYPRTGYALACLFYWMKAYRILYVSQVLGPKVITLFKMMQDLFFFLALYLITLISFSVPIYVLMFPNRLDGTSNFIATIGQLFHIVYARWWNVVGISLDDSRAEVDGTCSAALNLPRTEENNNETEDGKTDCSQRNVVGISLFVVFLILTNIMLLNMLIAMLTHTIEAVRERSIRLWRFHIYRMTYEFCLKPVLPPPFSIFEITYRLVRHVTSQSRPQSPNIKEYFSPNDFEYQMLSVFERNSAADLVEA